MRINVPVITIDAKSRSRINGIKVTMSDQKTGSSASSTTSGNGTATVGPLTIQGNNETVLISATDATGTYIDIPPSLFDVNNNQTVTIPLIPKIGGTVTGTFTLVDSLSGADINGGTVDIQGKTSPPTNPSGVTMVSGLSPGPAVPFTANFPGYQTFSSTVPIVAGMNFSVKVPMVKQVTGNISNKWIEIKAIQNNKWCLSPVSGVSNGYTPTSLITLLNQIYAAIGPYNIQKFVRTECPVDANHPMLDPNAIIIGGDGKTTVGALCRAAAAACHGIISNNLDMDSYPGVSDDCCSQTPGPNYPCAQTPANFFATNAQGLWNILPGAQCFMEAWCPGAFDHVVNQDWVSQPKYYSDLAPNLTSPGNSLPTDYRLVVKSNASQQQTFLNAFFQTLRKIGFTSFCYNSGEQSSGHIWSGNSFGNSQYARVAISQSDMATPPQTPLALTQRLSWINQLQAIETNGGHPLTGIIFGLDVQPQNGTSAAAEFRTKVTNKAAWLTDLFAGQNGNNSVKAKYIAIAPVLCVQDPTTLVYDAAFDGTLPLLQNLLKQYNP